MSGIFEMLSITLIKKMFTLVAAERVRIKKHSWSAVLEENIRAMLTEDKVNGVPVYYTTGGETRVVYYKNSPEITAHFATGYAFAYKKEEADFYTNACDAETRVAIPWTADHDIAGGKYAVYFCSFSDVSKCSVDVEDAKGELPMEITYNGKTMTFNVNEPFLSKMARIAYSLFKDEIDKKISKQPERDVGPPLTMRDLIDDKSLQMTLPCTYLGGLFDGVTTAPCTLKEVGNFYDASGSEILLTWKTATDTKAIKFPTKRTGFRGDELTQVLSYAFKKPLPEIRTALEAHQITVDISCYTGENKPEFITIRPCTEKDLNIIQNGGSYTYTFNYKGIQKPFHYNYQPLTHEILANAFVVLYGLQGELEDPNDVDSVYKLFDEKASEIVIDYGGTELGHLWLDHTSKELPPRYLATCGSDDIKKRTKVEINTGGGFDVLNAHCFDTLQWATKMGLKAINVPKASIVKDLSYVDAPNGINPYNQYLDQWSVELKLENLPEGFKDVDLVVPTVHVTDRRAYGIIFFPEITTATPGDDVAVVIIPSIGDNATIIRSDTRFSRIIYRYAMIDTFTLLEIKLGALEIGNSGESSDSVLGGEYTGCYYTAMSYALEGRNDKIYTMAKEVSDGIEEVYDLIADWGDYEDQMKKAVNDESITGVELAKKYYEAVYRNMILGSGAMPDHRDTNVLYFYHRKRSNKPNPVKIFVPLHNSFVYVYQYPPVKYDPTNVTRYMDPYQCYDHWNDAANFPLTMNGNFFYPYDIPYRHAQDIDDDITAPEHIMTEAEATPYMSFTPIPDWNKATFEYGGETKEVYIRGKSVGHIGASIIASFLFKIDVSSVVLTSKLTNQKIVEVGLENIDGKIVFQKELDFIKEGEVILVKKIK